MNREGTTITWFITLVSEVIIFKNLIYLKEVNNNPKAFHVILTAPFLPWLFCVSIGIWILILNHRYLQEVMVKPRIKILYTILFSIAIILLTISALLFLDVSTMKKGPISWALISLGGAHIVILLTELYVFRPKEESSRRRVEYLQNKNELDEVIIWSGFRFYSGCALIIFGFLSCEKFTSLSLQYFVYLLLIIIMAYDLISGDRKSEIDSEDQVKRTLIIG